MLVIIKTWFSDKASAGKAFVLLYTQAEIEDRSALIKTMASACFLCILLPQKNHE